jgi:thiamine-phosphate pyrophosphorylase
MSLKRKPFRNFSLTAITDLKAEEPESLARIEASLRGGVDLIQLRSKHLSDSILYRLGVQIKKLADRYGKIFIVNDRVDLAKAVDADGVHLGQDDLPMEAARRILQDPSKWIGISTHSLEQAVRAEETGADYIGVGPIFQTPTKPGYLPVGLDLIEKVRERITIPFVAIGGIDGNNIEEVLSHGAMNVAIVRAVLGQADPYEAARKLKTTLEHYEMSLLQVRK